MADGLEKAAAAVERGEAIGESRIFCAWIDAKSDDNSKGDAEMKLYVYRVDPIDFWHGWMEADKYIAQIAAYATETDDWSPVDNYRAMMKAGQEAAYKLNWEGDMRDGTYISGLPGRNSGEDGNIMIAWKQDHGGVTFVISTILLPWLLGDAVEIESQK